LALFEIGLDASKRRVQVRAEALRDRDDCDRDAGGDDAGRASIESDGNVIAVS
jgi:hypothetical protein